MEKEKSSVHKLFFLTLSCDETLLQLLSQMNTWIMSEIMDCAPRHCHENIKRGNLFPPEELKNRCSQCAETFLVAHGGETPHLNTLNKNINA